MLPEPSPHRIYEHFFLHVRTGQGFPISVVGVLRKREKKTNAILEEIKVNLQKMTLEEDVYFHPPAIDRALAEALVRDVPPSVLCLGASFNLPQGEGPAGGVIGSPANEVSLTMGDIEEIEDDFFLLTYPGGPGLGIHGSFSACFALREHVSIQQGWLDIPQMLMGLKEEEIPLMIGVTDGTGTERPGSVMAYHHGELVIRCVGFGLNN